MGFGETQKAKRQRIDSIRPDIENLEREMRNFGQLEGEPHFIREAVRQACQAALKGNYGIGAVAVHEEKIVARGQNRLGEVNNPMHHVLHAEMDTLRDYHEKVKPRDRRHSELTMYTTLEPCPLCTCGMFNAGVKKAVGWSANQPSGCNAATMERIIKRNRHATYNCQCAAGTRRRMQQNFYDD